MSPKTSRNNALIIHRHVLLFCMVLLMTLSVLTGCGSSGGGGGETPSIDTTPDEFTFAAKTGVAKSTVTTSNTITVSGINDAAAISISGADGTYSINGGVYTNAVGTVTDGDRVSVKLTSSNEYNTAVATTLNIGGVTGPFNVTTEPNGSPIDTIPDAFTFTTQFNVNISTVVTSNEISVSGINSPAAISISGTGGTYSINGGDYTTADGNVKNGDKITIKVTSSPNNNTTVSAVLSIGGVPGTFNVITKAVADTIPDTFAFTPRLNVARNTALTSNQITVSGINSATSISIIGADGAYSINGGAYTNIAETVTAGDKVSVRLTSSSSYNTPVVTTLTIGGVTGTFNVTTEKDSTPTDTTPDAFTFSDQTDMTINTVLTSNQITVTGINATAAISISGADGTYSINGGNYTYATGFVNNGDKVSIRVTTSSSYSTVVYAALSIGGITGAFNVSTEAEAPPADAVPDTFTFASQTGVPISTITTSNEITVAGMNAAAPISIAFGTYSINGGIFTSIDGTVNNGDKVTVRLTSSSINNKAVSALLNIGGVVGVFVVETEAANTPTDITPDTFTFGAQTGMALITAINSNQITVSGINEAAAISISGVGGFYSINNGGYTNAAGTVINGDKVTVRLTSSSINNSAVSALLNIGGVIGSFNVVTKVISSVVAWQSLGPEGGKILSLAVDPANGQNVYAGTYGGLFKSTNGGISWNTINTGLTVETIHLIAIDPTNSQIVYAVASNRIYKTTNGGSTWSAANTGLTVPSIMSLVVDPTNSQTVYAGTMSGVYKTTDGSNTWSAINTGIQIISQIHTIAIDPTNSQVVYVGTYGSVYKTTNGGSAWSAINTGLTTGVAVMSLVIDPTNSQNIYAGTHSGTFKTTNGGISWSAINTGLNGIDWIDSLAIDPTNTQIVYAGTSGRMYKTTNGGNTWSAINTGLTGCYIIDSLAIDPTNGQNLYVGGGSDGVYKTTNGGTVWSAINTGLKGNSIESLVIDPINSQNVYAGALGGHLYKTTNGGSTWSSINSFINSLAIDPANSQIVYAGHSTGVYKTINGGSTWIDIDNGLSNNIIFSLAVDPTNSQILYAGTNRGINVYKTINGGSTWSAMDTGMPTNFFVLSLAVDPTNSQNVYAGGSKGLYKTTNGGSAWSAIDTGILINSCIYSLAIDPTNSQNVYAGSNSSVYKSTNGGSTWIVINTGLPYKTLIKSLAIDPANSQNVYAGTNSGVYKSTNGGSTWIVFNTGLPGNLPVLSLAIDPFNSQNVYAGTRNGVFKM